MTHSKTLSRSVTSRRMIPQPSVIRRMVMMVMIRIA